MRDRRSKARQQLLVYYFTNSIARHHLRDLAERLSIDPSNGPGSRLCHGMESIALTARGP